MILRSGLCGSQGRVGMWLSLLIYVWRRSHETFMPQCLGQYGDQDRPSAVSVLFWGCITYKGVGKLVPVEGNMNS
jgi:hypothetical protein